MFGCMRVLKNFTTRVFLNFSCIVFFFDTAYLFASSILLKYSAQANCKDAI